MNLSEFKAQYPQYNDMSDSDLADALHKKYYSDMPREQFFKDAGVKSKFASAQETPTSAADPMTGIDPTGASAIDPAPTSVMDNAPIRDVPEELDATKVGFANASANIAARDADTLRMKNAPPPAVAQNIPDSKYRLENIAGNFSDNARNVSSGILKIAPTALKGIADIGRMASGDTVGKDTSKLVERGMAEIDDIIASPQFNQENIAFKKVMSDPNAHVGDMFSYLIDHPSILLDNGITTLGSMALPGGVAFGAAKLLGRAGMSAAKAGSIAAGSVIGTSGVQNAADTFSSDALENLPLSDRYKGAAISAGVSILVGIATGGGAEGAIARKMAGDLQSGKIGLETVKQYLMAIGKEATQEAGEEFGNAAGEAAGSLTAPNATNLAKRMAFAGTLGGLMGGGTHVLTSGESAEAKSLRESTEAAEQSRQNAMGKGAAIFGANSAFAQAAGITPSTIATVAGIANPDTPDTTPSRFLSEDEISTLERDAATISRDEQAQAHRAEFDATLANIGQATNIDEALASFKTAMDVPINLDLGISAEVMGKDASIRSLLNSTALNDHIAGLDEQSRTTLNEGIDAALNDVGSTPLREDAVNTAHQYLTDKGVFANHVENERIAALQGTPEEKATIAQAQQLVSAPEWGAHRDSQEESNKSVLTAAETRIANPDLHETERAKTAQETLDYAKKVSAATIKQREQVAKETAKAEVIKAEEAEKSSGIESPEKLLALLDIPKKHGKVTLVPVDSLANTPSGKASKITPNEAAIVQSIGQALGKEVHFFEQSKHVSQLDGMAPRAHPNKIFINVNAGHAAWHYLAGHEFFHQLPDDIKASFTEAIKPEVSTKGYTDLVDYINQTHLDENGQWEEISADLFGNRFGDQEFWDRVISRIEDPTAAQKLVEYIREFVAKIIAAAQDGKKFETDGFVKDLEKVREAAANALHEYLVRSQGIGGKSASEITADRLMTMAKSKGKVADKAKAELTRREEDVKSKAEEKVETSNPEKSVDQKREPASWVIKNKETGEIIMETFDRKKVNALNTDKYEAVPILDHLVGINKAIKGETVSEKPTPIAKGKEVSRYATRRSNAAGEYVGGSGMDAFNAKQFASELNKKNPTIQYAPEERPNGTFEVVGRKKSKADAALSSSRDKTKTEAFKKWFNGSVVVDADGNPLMVYHGTNKSEDGQAFSSFDTYGSNYGLMGTGGYFTDNPDIASSYTTKGKGDSPSVYPVYMSVKNPLNMDKAVTKELPLWQNAFPDVDFANSDRSPKNGDHYTNEDFYRITEDHFIDEQYLKWEAAEAIQDGLRNMGYDGVTHIGGGRVQSDGTRHRVYIAFDPEQIKSATGNTGDFDSMNSDIRYSVDRKQTETPAFKKWFGDSKVVDEEGKPLVSYHGTSHDFTNFSGRPDERSFIRKALNKFGIAYDSSVFSSNYNERSAGSKALEAGATWFTDSAELASDYAEANRLDGTNPNVMPVYISMQKPVIFDANAKNMTMPNGDVKDWSKFFNGDDERYYRNWNVMNSIALHAARVNGGDGVILRGVFDKPTVQSAEMATNIFITFNPTQIKSATGNNGDFDASNPDIRYSSGRPAYAAPPSTVKAAWGAPIMSKMDDVIYRLQDRQIDTKRIVDTIKSTAKAIHDKFDPYLQEELFHGRSAKAVQDFLSDELRPLLQDMQMRKVDMADFEDYLHARHAEERNDQNAKINPNMPDGGSGIDTADARAYLAGLPPAKRAMYQALAQRVYNITKETKQLLIDSGLESKDTIKAWDGTYKYYVPLMREDESGGSGVGQGFSVKGNASKRAMGSSRAVVDIIANVAMQRERAIVRAEKNRVAQAIYGLALQSPNPEFWVPINPEKDKAVVLSELIGLGMNPADAANILAEPTQQYINPKTGLVDSRINPMLRNSESVISMRVNGKDRFVFFNEGDERAMRMVKSLKNLDSDEIGMFLGAAAKVTRYFAAINTQYNPIFGVVNLMRDSQDAILNLSTTPIAQHKTAVLKNILPALTGIYIAERQSRNGVQSNSVWANLFEEFQNEGGQTGYKNMFSQSKERTDALKKELAQISEGKVKKAGRAVFDWLSDYNEAMENATRLAAYKVAKEQGISNQRAASLAKNLTVNFNRKGQLATQAGALYAFFNASVQGTTRMGKTLSGPAGKKIIAGGLILGSMQALMMAAAGFDDDEPPEFVKAKSVVIPIGNGKYLTMPMPLGFAIIPTISRLATEFALHGFKKPTKYAANLIDAVFGTFNPIGNSGFTVQTLAPTFADPLVALAENKDFTGKNIAKPDMNGLAPTPGHTRAKDTASGVGKAISYWTNAASGGTKYTPGMLSPTPDQIDYLIGQATGGVGRELMKAQQAGSAMLSGEELPPNKVPLLGRFYGDTKGQASIASKFYDNVKEINQHELEIKGRRKDKGDVLGYIRDNPDSRLVEVGNATERQVSELKQRKRDLLAKDASKESIKVVELQITNAMQKFNDRVDSTRAKPKKADTVASPF